MRLTSEYHPRATITNNIWNMYFIPKPTLKYICSDYPSQSHFSECHVNHTVGSLFSWFLSLTIMFVFASTIAYIRNMLRLLLINIPLYWFISSLREMCASGINQDTETTQ